MALGKVAQRLHSFDKVTSAPLGQVNGIRVNTLTPSGLESGLHQVFSKRYCARAALRRMAQSGDMESALLYLASDASAYVTGQNLIVDGGLTCW